jgi:hypothetical protein
LKLRSVEWARESGIEYLYTGNDSLNARMLEINVRLGYRPMPELIEVMRDLSARGSVG